jgi:hypothetical protein
MTAKVTVVAGVMLVFGAIIAVGAFTASQAVLSGRHIGLPFGYPGVLRAIIASAVLAPVCALVGMGIGALIRHSATTIVATVLVLMMAPLLIQSNHEHWVIVVHRTMPLIAWDRLTEPGTASPYDHLPTLTGAWIIYAAWALIGAVLAVVVVDRRDV